MPRQIIYFTQETWDELKAYIEAKYGRPRAISITVEQAVRDFLEKNSQKAVAGS